MVVLVIREKLLLWEYRVHVPGRLGSVVCFLSAEIKQMINITWQFINYYLFNDSNDFGS